MAQTRRMEILTQIFFCVLMAGCASTPGRDKPLDPAMAFVVSPNNSVLAVTTDSQEVALFDVSPLRFRSLLTSEGEKVKPKTDQIFRSPPLALSPDGQQVFVAGVHNRLIAWDVGTGSQVFNTPIEAGVTDLVVFPDGHAFITVGPGVVIWKTDTGIQTGTLELPNGLKGVSGAISNDGQAILVGLSNGDIAIYNTTDGKLTSTLKGHQTSVTGLAVGPDGKTFASSAGLYDPRLWKIDIEQQSVEATTDVDLTTTAAKAGRGTQTMKMLAWMLGTASGFQLVGAPTLGAPPSSSSAASKDSNWCGPRVTFSADGRYLAATANLSMISGEFQLFIIDLASNQTRTITGIYGCSVAFTKDSKIVITGGLGGPVLWNPETGQKMGIREEKVH
jgi:WD40 repeat protein